MDHLEQLLKDEEQRRNSLLQKRVKADADADEMLALMEQHMESMLGRNRSIQTRSEN